MVIINNQGERWREIRRGAVTDKSLTVVFDWPVLSSGRLWSVVLGEWFHPVGWSVCGLFATEKAGSHVQASLSAHERLQQPD